MRKLLGFHYITHYAEPCLSPTHDYEKTIFNKIKDGMEAFRLKDVMRSKSVEKAYRARFELCMQGQLIIVFGKDVNLYSLSKLQYAPNELVALTYQSTKIPFDKTSKEHTRGTAWRDVWVETYNAWVSDYSPKVWEGVSI